MADPLTSTFFQLGMHYISNYGWLLLVSPLPFQANN